jgi:hypothetical protein
MKWITRERIQVNRTATCWLITRFIDPAAEFLFSPADEVASLQLGIGATGFDAPDASYPHKGEAGLCSFAVLVRERLAHDPVLVEMARIVPAADFNDQLDDHPAARGLQLISRGFPLVTNNDHDTAERAAFVYDALYASISETRSHKLEIGKDEPQIHRSGSQGTEERNE